MYIYKTFNPSEPVRKVRYWATKESRQDYLRYQFRTKGMEDSIQTETIHLVSNKYSVVNMMNEELAKAILQEGL